MWNTANSSYRSRPGLDPAHGANKRFTRPNNPAHPDALFCSDAEKGPVPPGGGAPCALPCSPDRRQGSESPGHGERAHYHAPVPPQRPRSLSSPRKNVIETASLPGAREAACLTPPRRRICHPPFRSQETAVSPGTAGGRWRGKEPRQVPGIPAALGGTWPPGGCQGDIRSGAAQGRGPRCAQ